MKEQIINLMHTNSKIQTIQFTIQDIWNASKSTVTKNKKKYSRKDKHRVKLNTFQNYS